MVIRNKDLLAELGDYRVGHMPALQNFDFDSCAKSEIIFFQAFENESFPNIYKVFFSREDSVDKLSDVNSSTGTPTPWKIYQEIIFFGEGKNVLKIFTSLKKYKISANTYSIEKNFLGEIISENNKDQDREKLIGKQNSDQILNQIIINRTHSKFATEKIGFVYCFKHVRSPDRCKIGYTNRDPRIRAAENSIEANLPEPYLPIFICASFNAYELEQRIHELLSEIHIAKEYFQLNPQKIVSGFIEEFDSGSIFGFFSYVENQHQFSDLSFQDLIFHHRKEKIKLSKKNFEKRIEDFYLDFYRKSYQKIFFERIKILKYLDRLKPLELQRDNALTQKNKLLIKTGAHDQKQKDLTKSGGIISALGLAVIDGGASLVPAAATAAGLFFNKKKNEKNKNELDNLEDKLSEIESLISKVHSEIHIELVEQCEFLDDFFSSTYKKIFRKIEPNPIHCGYLISLQPKGIIYKNEHIFNLLALSVVSNPPANELSNDSFYHIRLECFKDAPAEFSPYELEEIFFSEDNNCESVIKLLLDFAIAKNSSIPIRGDSLSDEMKY